jgi:hypothetical protein
MVKAGIARAEVVKRDAYAALVEFGYDRPGSRYIPDQSRLGHFHLKSRGRKTLLLKDGKKLCRQQRIFELAGRDIE